MTDEVTSSDVSRIIPSKGYVGAYLNFGVAELSFSINQDGVRSGGFTWIGWDVVSIDGDAESFGLSTPTPFAQIGEEYTPDGTYGTFAVGTPVLGLNFGVHQNNPRPGIGPGSGTVEEVLDANGNVIGRTYYHEERSLKHGWQYRIVTIDSHGNQIGSTQIVPMPVENQLFSATRCFPAHTRIQTSRSTSTAISALRVGDIVLAFDARADKGRGALIPRRVTRLYRNTTTEWIRLRWFDGTAREGGTTPGRHGSDTLGGFTTPPERARTGSAKRAPSSGALRHVTAERAMGKFSVSGAVKRKGCGDMGRSV